MPPATAAALCAAAGAMAPALAAAAGAAPGFAAGPRDFAASTSDLTMRPCGPLPETDFRSTPASAAMRRANGLAKTRSLLAAGAGAVASVGCIGLGTAAGADCGTAAAAGGAAGGAL